MGWEKRKNGRYYYTKTRIGSRVISNYVGNGRNAELIDQLSAMCREEAMQKRASIAAEIEAMEAEDQAVDDIVAAVDKLMRETLQAAGFHQHARGQWRRKRNGKSHCETESTSTSTGN